MQSDRQTEKREECGMVNSNRFISARNQIGIYKYEQVYDQRGGSQAKEASQGQQTQCLWIMHQKKWLPYLVLPEGK